MNSMQTIGQFLQCTTGVLGVLKQVHHWAYGKTTKRDALLSILKFFNEARGFPSLAQGKEIDSGIVA